MDNAHTDPRFFPIGMLHLLGSAFLGEVKAEIHQPQALTATHIHTACHSPQEPAKNVAAQTKET